MVTLTTDFFLGSSFTTQKVKKNSTLEKSKNKFFQFLYLLEYTFEFRGWLAGEQLLEKSMTWLDTVLWHVYMTRTNFLWTFPKVGVQRVDLGKLSEVDSLVRKVEIVPKVHFLWHETLPIDRCSRCLECCRKLSRFSCFTIPKQMAK